MQRKKNLKCQVISTHAKNIVTKSRYLFQNSCTCDKTGGMKKIVRAMLVLWKEREREIRKREKVLEKKK